MNTLAPYSQDQLATKYGGWARLCDPKFILMDELYSAFEAAGLSRSEFNKMREEQKMPARQRVVLDAAEDLVRIWVRYLSGFLSFERGIFTGSFIHLGQGPLTQIFLQKNGDTLHEYSISAEDLDSFIQSCIKSNDPALSTEYVSSRMARIGSLARLCQQSPPKDPGDEGDLGPAPVPLSPMPPSNTSSIALPLPTEEKD